MASRKIWIKGRELYFYDTYHTWKKAKAMAKYFQQKYKNNYFIYSTESNITGRRVFYLYMNKLRSFV